MPHKPQFSLRSLAILVAVIGAILALFRVLQPEWRIVTGVAIVVIFISLVSLISTQRRPSRRLSKFFLIVVALASAWFLWLGIYPAMYYMLGLFLMLVIWFGVLMACLTLSITSFASPASSGTRVPTRVEIALLVVPFVTTLLLALQIPMRIAAINVVPTLANRVSSNQAAAAAELQCGLYSFKVPGKRRAASPDVLYFQLAKDSESAFVYSPSGIDDIHYNAGNMGRLFGDWYWICED